MARRSTISRRPARASWPPLVAAMAAFGELDDVCSGPREPPRPELSCKRRDGVPLRRGARFRDGVGQCSFDWIHGRADVAHPPRGRRAWSVVGSSLTLGAIVSGLVPPPGVAWLSSGVVGTPRRVSLRRFRAIPDNSARFARFSIPVGVATFGDLARLLIRAFFVDPEVHQVEVALVPPIGDRVPAHQGTVAQHRACRSAARANVNDVAKVGHEVRNAVATRVRAFLALAACRQVTCLARRERRPHISSRVCTPARDPSVAEQRAGVVQATASSFGCADRRSDGGACPKRLYPQHETAPSLSSAQPCL